MRVIVTGSRRWSLPNAVYDALEGVLQEHGPFTLVHGACSTGADYYAEMWWNLHGRHSGVECIRFKADWERLGRAAGPERNERMVKAGADLVLAFPMLGGRGTQGTVVLARAAGIRVQEWDPDV